jgi:manganese/zinc/iron transport system substrate-binding protein
MWMKRAYWLLALLILPLLASCGRIDEAGAPPADLAQRPIKVVATIGMIGDLARNVGGERVEVVSLMGPGVDPHLYKASANDLTRLQEADIIFYGGLELEGRMTDVLVKLASTKPAVAVSDLIPAERLREPPEFEGKFDPHIWFDPTLWEYAAQSVSASLAKLDPSYASLYQRNADAYIAQLKELDAYAAQQLAGIPAESRVLITAHDAFGYFGERYQVEVRGLQGTSTAAEAGAADVQGLAELIAERKIKAIFVEASVPHRTIEAVQEAVRARGWEVAIGGQLYSDSMGNEGTPEGSYLGMFRHNVDTIVRALT